MFFSTIIFILSKISLFFTVFSHNNSCNKIRSVLKGNPWMDLCFKKGHLGHWSTVAILIKGCRDGKTFMLSLSYEGNQGTCQYFTPHRTQTMTVLAAGTGCWGWGVIRSRRLRLAAKQALSSCCTSPVIRSGWRSRKTPCFKGLWSIKWKVNLFLASQNPADLPDINSTPTLTLDKTESFI